MTESTTLLQKIAASLEGLLILTITTSVGERTLKTTIHLVDGDIRNDFDPAFVTGDLKELVPFHESQVAKGQQIIKDNLATLKDLFNFVRDNAAELGGSSSSDR